MESSTVSMTVQMRGQDRSKSEQEGVECVWGLLKERGVEEVEVPLLNNHAHFKFPCNFNSCGADFFKLWFIF